MRRTFEREDWIGIGRQALVAEGPNAMRVEPLARQLGATKGSFYWHFEDVGTFETAIITAWLSEALDRLQNKPSRYALIMFLGPDHMLPEEAPIRVWARTSKVAADAVGSVDASRLTFVRNCLEAMGVDDPHLPWIFCGAKTGVTDLAGDGRDAAPILAHLLDMLLPVRR